MNRITLVFLCAAAIFAFGLSDSCQVSAQHHRSVGPVEPSDPLSSANVSFGGWMANPHLCPPVGGNPPAPCPIVDRFPANPATQFPRFSNHHALSPEIAKIKAGGVVNFILGGLHVVAVYDNGTRPADIDQTHPPCSEPAAANAADHRRRTKPYLPRS